MRNVVVTGLGFATSIGNNASAVLDSLQNLKHGIAPFVDAIDPSNPVHVAGNIQDFNTTGYDPEDWTYPEEYNIRREVLRGLSPHGLYALCATQQAIDITVRSILGRFLEHSRIYYFENAGHESELFAGSADWMPRNFFRRIEAVFPIENKELKDKFIHLWIPAFMKDTSSAKELDLNGSYINPNPEETTDKISAQAYFMRLSEEARQIYKT